MIKAFNVVGGHAELMFPAVTLSRQQDEVGPGEQIDVECQHPDMGQFLFDTLSQTYANNRLFELWEGRKLVAQLERQGEVTASMRFINGEYKQPAFLFHAQFVV